MGSLGFRVKKVCGVQVGTRQPFSREGPGESGQGQTCSDRQPVWGGT